ncbi:MAG: HAMP domain-containing histidine kinase [bacterium]|nr:HAMP domain-containing histidine kinase [bacterium]
MTALVQAVTHRQDFLRTAPFLERLAHSITHPVFVLRSNQRIVFANKTSLQWLGLTSDNLLQGSKLTDILSEEDMKLKDNTEEIIIQDETFLLVTLEDHCKQSQRMLLERTFYHDLLNTAGGMQGLSEFLHEASREELPSLTQTVNNMANQLVDEILSQRDLLAAESGELFSENREMHSQEILETTCNTYKNHSNFNFRIINISPEAKNFSFHSDPILVGRILGNMVKNALEGSHDPAPVTLNCGQNNSEVWFSVHNLGFIPPDHQRKIFKQSFSTKGSGRGTGTFSMKLFAEKYLKGRIEFKSDAASGTVFKISLPSDGS